MPYKSKDNENITKTMQDKSGIYQDRTDGKLVHFLERHHIEGGSAQMIAANLQAAYDEFC